MRIKRNYIHYTLNENINSMFIFLEYKFSHAEEITFIVLILSPGKCYLLLLLHRDIEILVETT